MKSRALLQPDMVIQINRVDLQDDATLVHKEPLILKLSRVNPNSRNNFFYGSVSSQPYYLLMDAATVEALARPLLDK